MKEIQIIPVLYGNSTLPENDIFAGCNNNKSRPIVFMVYLLKTENRLILVDAGCETMPGFEMKNFIGPVNALKKIGVSVADITDVIITHAHHDHIECVSKFANAKIHIQKDEFESGKKYFSSTQNVSTFSLSAKICPGISVIKIGGHSIGSCIVEIEKSDKLVVIAGDECYVRECLEKKIPTASSHCPKKSREFVEKYSDKTKYTVLLCHDS